MPDRSRTAPRPKAYPFLLLLVIFMPRLLQLDIFLTADEPLFLSHARQFAAAFSGGDLTQTLGIGYPGVTLAAWVAPIVGDAPGELKAYAAGRAATALLTGLLLICLYRLAARLWGRHPALVGAGLLAVDPYSLAYSRLLHIAAPLALLMSLAGLAYLLWLRDRRRRWLMMTGLATGLALLTKSTALLLAPMLAMMLLIWSLSSRCWRNWGWWASQFKAALLLALGAAILFFLLWPAMWVDPIGGLRLTFGKLFTDQEAGAGNLGLFWLGRFVQDPGPFFYPVAFLLKATPWLLLGLALSLYRLIRKKNQSSAQDFDPSLTFSAALWIFALTYLLFMTLASKKSIRYMLPAFPILYLLAGQALWQSYTTVSRGLRSSLFQKGNYPPFVVRSAYYVFKPLRTGYSPLQFLTILLPLFFTLIYHPYYLTYYNPLLLGWRWAPNTLLVGWGEGLDRAAHYLDNHGAGPVAAWYEWLFPLLYSGSVEPVVPPENLILAPRTVLYINQVQRDIPNPNIIHYFRSRRRPEYTVRLAGIDYAWVYPGPIAGFQPVVSPQFALGGQFGEEAQLLGYDLSPPSAAGGDSLIVTLHWQALTTPPGDRFVYLRLVDNQGRIWARADSPPVMGLWPSTRWQPQMVIEDAHAVPIPAGTPPGSYRLEAGLYDPDSGRLLAAVGQPLGQGGGLLLGEVNLGWRPLVGEPDLPARTNRRLAPNAYLVGYSQPEAEAVTGQFLSVDLAWREAAGLTTWLFGSQNDLVMFEWRQNGRPLAEQADPLPLPVDRWGRGALLISRHQLLVPPTLATGTYQLVVMLHNGSDPAGEAFPLNKIAVTAPPRRFDLLPEAIAPNGPSRLATDSPLVSLVGYTLDRQPQRLELQLYWQPLSVTSTGYKVFVQMLGVDNRLLAQSDSVPAAGQRPTTGWLPGEVVVDPHTLALPADLPSGIYRLIAGLYDPLTGQRLALHDASGVPIGDSIAITEVSFP